MAMNVDELEAWIDESIRLSQSKGYYPRDFIRMRYANGHRSVGPIERLVQSGEIQSGFKRMKKIGLLAWSLEAAVLKFPERFTKAAQTCADFRLNVLAKEI
jgi:hypothetical protein